MDHMHKILTVVIVARNNLHQTQKCLESLHQHTNPDHYRILFMDNGSEQETSDWVLCFCRENGIELKYQYSSENEGWINRINQAYKMVDTELSLTCHNDVVFCRHWLSNMLRKFDEDEKVAAVGPVVTYGLGPQASHTAYATIGCEVKYLLGLFFMCRDSVLEEIMYEDGTYLSEAYGMGDKEELELCYRIRQKGYKLAIARDVLIEHEGEKTFIDSLGSKEAFTKYQDNQKKVLVRRLGKEAVDDIYTIDVKKPLKLMIGVMTRTNQFNVKFGFSLMGIWGKTPVYKEVLHIPRGMVAESRNKMIETAIQKDFSHILFVDDDMLFQDGAATHLLAHELDIVSGVAFQRAEPYMICQFKADDQAKRIDPYEAIGVGLVPVDAVGGFFLLCRIDALKKIPKPWFKYGDTSLGYGEAETGIGEDVYFGLKAKNHGIQTWVDTDLEIKHIGYEKEVGAQDYIDFRQKVERGERSYGEFYK